ncbi:MAG: cytochrome P450 [Actinomycetota bacterium]
MPLSDAPSALSTNPLVRIRDDLSVERRATRNGSLPPGPKLPSIARTERMRRDPLAVLLPAYEEHGPIFAIRIFHAIHVFMLGPEANRFILVTDRDKFRWRDGSLGDLIPLIGDGLLTTDGEYHDRAREIMVPVFHRKRIASAATVMSEEAERAFDGWRTGDRIDLYDWTRHVTMRVAMRALFGLDPDRARVDVAATFERGLSFYEREYFLQVVRGPGSPFARLRRVRRTLDHIILSEIARRRSAGKAGEDILGLLMEAEDSEGIRFTDEQVRDQVLTLLFAGHDTTTSTVAFLFYELARNPDWAERLAAERDSVVGDGTPDATQLFGELPELGMAVDETLRLYPPAWIGPRRAVEDFEFGGYPVPAGLPVNYSSWASHRLPDVFSDPHSFRPERFAPSERAKLPKGAYVPFGGGPRICIGMRFGELEIRAIAAAILRRFRLELEPDWRMRIRQMPTLSPRGGLPMRIRASSM